MARLTVPQSVAEWNELGREYLPGHLGIVFISVEADEVRARMRVERRICASNGYLHAGAVVSFADTCCGYATMRNLPEGAEVIAEKSGKAIAHFRNMQKILYPRNRDK